MILWFLWFLSTRREALRTVNSYTLCLINNSSSLWLINVSTEVWSHVGMQWEVKTPSANLPPQWLIANAWCEEQNIMPKYAYCPTPSAGCRAYACCSLPPSRDGKYRRSQMGFFSGDDLMIFSNSSFRNELSH
jgi:hypothetical protein